MKRSEYKRGNIVYMDLGKREGSLQCGFRYGIITSNDYNNYYSDVLDVAPITKAVHKANKQLLPTHVLMNKGILKYDSIIMAEQETPIIREKISCVKGTLNESILQKLDSAIAVQHGLVIYKDHIATICNLKENIKMFKHILTTNLGLLASQIEASIKSNIDELNLICRAFNLILNITDKDIVISKKTKTGFIIVA